ncbi:hypothetical protein [Methanoculleus sp.]|uniref:hypothetical protein n=1 Tax=Methanoculleus sp. TaxID=90427 RepID=UPI0025CDC340|nr:hypothetical protein [Methanoculleus sp.]
MTVAIQALVIGGLIVCIVVGTQDRPSSIGSPDGDTRNVFDRPESASPAAYSIIGNRPDLPVMSVRAGAGNTLSFSNPS